MRCASSWALSWGITNLAARFQISRKLAVTCSLSLPANETFHKQKRNPRCWCGTEDEEKRRWIFGINDELEWKVLSWDFSKDKGGRDPTSESSGETRPLPTPTYSLHFSSSFSSLSLTTLNIPQQSSRFLKPDLHMVYVVSISTFILTWAWTKTGKLDSNKVIDNTYSK